MKKRFIALLLSVSTAVSLFAPMALAEANIESRSQQIQSQNENQGHIIELGKDELSRRAINALPIMNNYITSARNHFTISAGCLLHNKNAEDCSVKVLK